MEAMEITEVGETSAPLNGNVLKCCVIIDLRKIYNFYLHNIFVECKIITWRQSDI
jgi:hypothetical protein